MIVDICCCQLSADCRVFVVAVTRKRDDVNPALTISTRISIELEMTVPNAAQRRDVSLLPSLASSLAAMHHYTMHNL